MESWLDRWRVCTPPCPSIFHVNQRLVKHQTTAIDLKPSSTRSLPVSIMASLKLSATRFPITKALGRAATRGRALPLIIARRTVSSRATQNPNFVLDEPERLWEIGSSYWYARPLIGGYFSSVLKLSPSGSNYIGY